MFLVSLHTAIIQHPSGIVYIIGVKLTIIGGFVPFCNHSILERVIFPGFPFFSYLFAAFFLALFASYSALIPSSRMDAPFSRARLAKNLRKLAMQPTIAASASKPHPAGLEPNKISVVPPAISNKPFRTVPLKWAFSRRQLVVLWYRLFYFLSTPIVFL